MKIGILGTAHTFHQAPFNDESWELWGCNVGTVPRWDRWFEFHDDASIDTYPGHRAFLSSQTKPIYLKALNPEFPSGMAYPLDAMKAKYGDWFFTSTIAYMLALAIEEKPDEIGLWGVDMADSTEYAHQKPGCRFFIQQARMAGIKVTIPPESEIAAPGTLYGFDQPSWIYMKAKARKAELEFRAQEVGQRLNSLMLEKVTLKGALDVTLPKDQIQARLVAVEDELSRLERDALVLDGGVQDITHILINWTGEFHG